MSLVDFEITDLEIEKQEAIYSHMARMIAVNQDKIEVNNNRLSALEAAGGTDPQIVILRDENRGCQRMIERLNLERAKDRKKLDGDPTAEEGTLAYKGWIAYLAEKKEAGEPAIIQIEDGMPL